MLEKTLEWMVVAIVLICIFVMAFSAGCNEHTPHTSNALKSSDGVFIDKMEVDGHEYLASYSDSTFGGVSLLHSASCPCQEDE